MSLDSAILDADKTVKDGSQPPPLPQDDKTPKGDENEIGADGLTAGERENAINFFKGLKDPDQAPTLIGFIAEKAGYTKIENKQELKEAKRDIKGILKDKLGDEYEGLIEKLGPALEEILTEKLEESTKGIKEDLEKDRREKINNESAVIVKGISKEFYDGKDIPDDIAKEMTSLMDDFAPKPGMTLEKYLKSIHTLALGNLGKSTNNSRVERNRNDAPSRLASDRTSPTTDSERPKTKGLDAAVKAAVEEVEKKLNK